jgi:hypothetical protein
MNERPAEVGNENWINPLFDYLKTKSDKNMHGIQLDYDGSDWFVSTYNILSLGYNVILQRGTPHGIEKYTVADATIRTAAGYKRKDIELETFRANYSERQKANDRRDLLFSIMNKIISEDLIKEPES